MRMLLQSLSESYSADLLAHYQIAADGGTLIRDADEYQIRDIGATITKARERGFCLGAFVEGNLCGEIHASRWSPAASTTCSQI